MSRNVSLLLPLVCALGFGVQAQAQEALPLLPEILAQVQDSEVYLKGYLGTGPTGVQFALPEAGHAAFPVTFEADENLKAKIKACDFAGAGPCKVAAYGYVQWQGAVLGLIVTSIETQDLPGKMTP
jgi:hypothetical protein